jgi:hypothetical protein
MKKSDTHPMYSVNEAIRNLLEASINSYSTKAEDNPLTENERAWLHHHIDALNSLLNNFQKRVKS